jgi:hypothetical protein
MMEYIAILRLAQLTLGVMTGFGCIYLGYKLFALTINSPNTGQFKIPGLGEVNLRAAPGIFFALIGAIIIYVSVSRPMSVTDGTTTIQFQRPAP